MLLDRRRINRWAKWVSLGLAIVFAVSFLFLGIGSGLRVDWGDLWTSIFGGDDTQASTDSTGPEDLIQQYTAALAADPNDTTALLGLAAQYELLNQPAQAAVFLEQYVVIMPDDTQAYLRLANIYLAPETADYPSAVRVLNKATSLDDSNAQAFLMLGSAERSAGNPAAAILAWNRYLQLEPDSTLADTVKEEIASLVAASEATATAPPATTGTTTAP